MVEVISCKKYRSSRFALNKSAKPVGYFVCLCDAKMICCSKFAFLTSKLPGELYLLYSLEIGFFHVSFIQTQRAVGHSGIFFAFTVENRIFIIVSSCCID